MKLLRTIGLSTAAFALACAPVLAQMTQDGITAVPRITSSGTIVAGHGMTVYTYDKDTANKSACYGRCARIWEPLLGSEAQLSQMHPKGKVAAAFGLAPRKDGSAQWTYDGHPLYLYSKDTQKGEESGQGVRGVWHVAKATSE